MVTVATRREVFYRTMKPASDNFPADFLWSFDLLKAALQPALDWILVFAIEKMLK